MTWNVIERQVVLVHKNEFYSLWQQQDNSDQHHYPNSFSLSQSLLEDTTPGEQTRVVLRAEGPHCPAPAAVPTEARPGWEGSPASVCALDGGQLQAGNLLVSGRWKSSTHGRTSPQAGLEGNPTETDARQSFSHINISFQTLTYAHFILSSESA